jgi:hypothetical protein
MLRKVKGRAIAWSLLLLLARVLHRVALLVDRLLGRCALLSSRAGIQ